jgi:hypothetical protein
LPEHKIVDVPANHQLLNSMFKLAVPQVEHQLLAADGRGDIRTGADARMRTSG